jgi:uncharacterized membrane protein
MTAAESSGRAPRRSRGLIVALALSLTLNVFVVGGLLWAHMHFRRPLPPIQRFVVISREINLNDAQHVAFQHMIVTMRQRGRAQFQENHPLFDQIWDQLAKPQPDQKAIDDLINRVDENHRAFQKDMTANLEAFLATLTPEQRAQFAALAKYRRPPPPPP